MNPFRLHEVEAATHLALARGERVLQTHMYAATPRAHCAALLTWMAPPYGATVVDMGCGVGEVARHMAAMRQDLRFLLVNLSELQLAECPNGEQFVTLLADAHATHLPDDSADVVMFNSALVNMDYSVALAEAGRVLKPGGVLFLNEMLRVGGGNREFVDLLGAYVPTCDEMEDALARAALKVEKRWTPEFDDEAFRSKLGTAARLLDGVTTALWRVRK